MNLRDFNALVAGDKIENAMTHSKGVVSAVRDTGRPQDRIVSIKWGPGPEFSYTVPSTAWMHWSRREDDPMEIDPNSAGVP